MDTPGTPSFVIYLGLGQPPAPAADVLAAAAGQLAEHRPQIHEESDGQLVLQLTVDATDLWLALLTAMNATANLAYPPQWISAAPAPPPPGRPRTR